jgi:hypothetical protein
MKNWNQGNGRDAALHGKWSRWPESIAHDIEPTTVQTFRCMYIRLKRRHVCCTETVLTAIKTVFISSPGSTSPDALPFFDRSIRTSMIGIRSFVSENI